MAKSKKRSSRKVELKGKSRQTAYENLTKAKKKMQYNKKWFGFDDTKSFAGLNKKAIAKMGVKEVNSLNKSLEYYTYRGNPDTNFTRTGDGQYISNRTVDRVAKANRETRDKKKAMDKGLSEINVKAGDQELGMTAYQMNEMRSKRHTTNMYDVPDIDIKTDSKEVIERRLKYMERNLDEKYVNLREAQYKINHIANIYKRLNDTVETRELMKLLEAIPEDDYFELSKHFEDFKFLDPSKPLDADQASAEVEVLMGIIQQYNDGEIDMRLKFVN